MSARPRSTVGPLTILLAPAVLLLFGVAGCANSTAPTQASSRLNSVTSLQIQGAVRVSTDNTLARIAVVRIQVSTDSGPSPWAADTTSDGGYAVTVEVPGGCTPGASVKGVVSDAALGYAGRQTTPAFACTTKAQRLDVLVDSLAPMALAPAAVAGNLTATAVGAGRQFACAAAAGGAYCWGVGGESSALGQPPSSGDLTQPKEVTDGAGLTGVSAADKTACGLDQNGAAWCWGADDWGNLGVPDSTLDFPLQEFAGHAMAVQTDLRFTEVAAGTYTVCALTSAGAVYCWGCGATLGAGDSLRSSSVHPTPARVTSDRTFVQVGEGYETTCALDDAGNAWCWGRNSEGQLGSPQAPAGYYVTTPQQVTGGHQFVSIAVGGDHTCGLTASGEAWCWGSNGSGQLGDGKGGGFGEASSATPVPVFGGHVFKAIFAGMDETCGLTGDGTAWCWGADYAGQLGLGSQRNDVCGMSYCAPAPMPVSGGLKFSTMGAGEWLTCGITTGGKLYCWGLKEALGTG